MIQKALLAPVLVMCLIQIISSALFTYIFPFVASFLLSMDVDERDVPVYAGWADSMVSLVDVLGLPIHVRLIRYFPHRHLFVFTLLASGSTAAIIGFCTSPWQVVALRGVVGLVHFGGFIGVIALGELVDEESRNEAFSWQASGNALGAMSGSAIGGFLAEPYERVPIISGFKLFKVKPYAAPGIFLFGLSIITSVVILMVVPETNPRHRIITSEQVNQGSPVTTAPVEPSRGRLKTAQLLQSRRFLQISLAEVANKTCSFACLALFTTAGKLSPSIGGLGLKITEIARILSVNPLMTLVNLIFLFPWYSKHVSLRFISIISSGCWLLPAAFFPIAAFFATHPAPSLGWWLIYALWFVGHVGGMTWWTLKSLFLLRLYPDSSDRTLATGIIRLATNAGIVIGSAGSTRMFSIASGFAAGTFGRQLAWVLLGGFAVFTFAVGLSQPKMEGANPVSDLADSAAVDEETPLLRSEDPE